MERWLLSAALMRPCSIAPIVSLAFLAAACEHSTISVGETAPAPPSARTPYAVSAEAPAPAPTVLAELDGDIGSIAADETTLYVVTTTRVYSIPKQGGAAVTLAGGSDPNPDDALSGIAVDDTYVYFTMGGTTYPEKRFVARVPKSGGPVETIVSNVESACAVALNRGDLYILGDGVFRAPVTGGTATAMPNGAGGFRGWLVTDDAIWLSTDQPPYESMPLVGTPPDAAIYRLPVAGGALEVIAPSIGDFPAALARVRDQIAFTTSMEIALVPTAGGPMTTLDAFPIEPEALASDGKSLYTKVYAETLCIGDCRVEGTNELLRIDATGQPTVLARWDYPPADSDYSPEVPPPGTQHLVIDDEHVYVLDQWQGQAGKVLAARR